MTVEGFSKLSKTAKIKWLTDHYFNNNPAIAPIIKQYWNPDEALQQLHDEFVENTLTNYYLPYAVVPNFMVNGKIYAIPMVTEESSVIAASAKAAKFWAKRGGFRAHVSSMEKIGHVHFLYTGDPQKLNPFLSAITPALHQSVEGITRNMKKRGGGVTQLTIEDKTAYLPNYYRLRCSFLTADAMGANFINSCLERFAHVLTIKASEYSPFTPGERTIEIIMSILSNYAPQSTVEASVSCQVKELNEDGLSPAQFTQKFIQAVTIAQIDTYRAVTHNKGIMNGIDAVVVATGNDFRAVEAGAHAYAAAAGNYKSLSHATVENNIFTFSVKLPLAMGTVGGLTQLHPLAKLSLEMLGNPSAEELMQIIASVGLAQNFAALRSLITTGIQKGHMKMHLLNILNQLHATPEERTRLAAHFKNKTVTYNEVAEALKKQRGV
jgi:hydroxymethylglutaryl-CoA reductase